MQALLQRSVYLKRTASNSKEVLSSVQNDKAFSRFSSSTKDTFAGSSPTLAIHRFDSSFTWRCPPSFDRQMCFRDGFVTFSLWKKLLKSSTIKPKILGFLFYIRVRGKQKKINSKNKIYFMLIPGKSVLGTYVK